MLGTPAQGAELVRFRDGLTLGYLALVALTLLARGARRAREAHRGLVAVSYLDGRVAKVAGGTSVLEGEPAERNPACECLRRARPLLDLPGAGWWRAPATCRSRAPPSRPSLTGWDAGRNVRLACQLRPRADVTVAPLISPRIGLEGLRHLDPAAFGEERFVVAMFVDMRGSTRLAERRLPFDTVFVINRFLEAVSGGVVAAGGQPNQFLGDGMMALFGVGAPPAEAARQGLRAVALVAAHVEALNTTLAANLEEPIRFGIGLHAGTAISRRDRRP